MCSGFLRRLGALALCAVLLGALGGCGSAARPGGGTGCPLPGDPGDLGDAVEEKSEYTIGETASVGGCRVRLWGYSKASIYPGQLPDWSNHYFWVGILVRNDGEQPIQIGNFNAQDSRKWFEDLGQSSCTEEQIHAKMAELWQSAARNQVTALCGGNQQLCLAVGQSVPNQLSKVLNPGETGAVSVLCELPKNWDTLELTYSLNGEQVKFKVSSLDLGGAVII